VDIGLQLEFKLVNIKTQFSDNFSWQEVVITNHRNIVNELPAEYVANARFVVSKLEQVRVICGFPIIVNSWYRCPELNKAVRGSKNSDHLTAALKLGFKQLIYERNWVHISFDATPDAIPRNEVLTLLDDGKYAFGILI
jgi:hypothetical protein